MQPSLSYFFFLLHDSNRIVYIQIGLTRIRQFLQLAGYSLWNVDRVGYCGRSGTIDSCWVSSRPQGMFFPRFYMGGPSSWWSVKLLEIELTLLNYIHWFHKQTGIHGGGDRGEYPFKTEKYSETVVKFFSFKRRRRFYSHSSWEKLISCFLERRNVVPLIQEREWITFMFRLTGKKSLLNERKEDLLI